MRYKKLILIDYRGLTTQPKSKETIKTLSAHCTHTFNGDTFVDFKQKCIWNKCSPIKLNIFVLELLRSNSGTWQWKCESNDQQVLAHWTKYDKEWLIYQTHHQIKYWKVGQCDLVLAQWILSPLSFTLHHLRAGLLLEYTSSEQVMYLQPLIKRAYVFTLSKDMQFFFFLICNVTEMYFWKKDKENYPKNNHYLEEIWSDKLFTALVSPTMSPFAILCSHKHRTALDYIYQHFH